MKSYFSFLMLPFVLLLIPAPRYPMPDERALKLWTEYESTRLLIQKAMDWVAAEAVKRNLSVSATRKLAAAELKLISSFLAGRGVVLRCGQGDEFSVKSCTVLPNDCESIIHVARAPGYCKIKLGGLTKSVAAEVLLYHQEALGARYCAPITIESEATTAGH